MSHHRCLPGPVLSVTLVYCDQTVGWIKMPLGMKVDLGPGHIVLDGDSAPPRNGAKQHPTFWPMSIVAKRSPISADAEFLLQAPSECRRACRGISSPLKIALPMGDLDPI